MEFDEVELCGVHVSFYVSAYLFLFVIYVFFNMGFISPPAGVQGQSRNMGLGQRGLDTKLAYSAFGLLSFF